QPVYFLTPDVVGVHLTGALREGVTATDLALTVTQILRKAKVVGKFVEFFGPGAAALHVVDRATIANMAPEYGATMGYFPIDEETCQYLMQTGRSKEHVDTFRNYFKAQDMFGMPERNDLEYSQVLELNLADVHPSVAGPKRPQDRIELPNLKNRFTELFQKPVAENGYNKTAEEMGKRVHLSAGSDRHSVQVTGGGHQAPESAPAAETKHKTDKNTSAQTEVEMMNNRPTPDRVEKAPDKPLAKGSLDLGHGDVLIAAITSCTNTSNPSVMLAAGLLAKKAVEKGLTVRPTVKTSLAPGSRVVTEYLQQAGLQPFLDKLGFQTVGYGCTTCIGNSGPLDPRIEDVVVTNDLIAASVLSGNRNFEARVHQSIKANFLMSPPLVVAFALAGRVNLDLSSDPIGTSKDGEDVYLRDVWPSMQEINDLMHAAFDPETYQRL